MIKVLTCIHFIKHKTHTHACFHSFTCPCITHLLIHSYTHIMYPVNRVRDKLVRQHRYLTRAQARNMEANQDNPNQDHPNQDNPDQDNPNQGNQKLGNQELRAEIDGMKKQIAEILKVLQALKNGNADEDVSAGNTENQATNPPLPSPDGPGIPPPTVDANPEDGPSGAVGQQQPTPTGHDGNSGAPQTPIPSLVVAPQRFPLGHTPPLTTGPQAHESNLTNPTHSRIPNVNPAIVPMIHPYYGMSGLPQSYPMENPQAKDKLQRLDERLRAVEGSNVGARDAYDLCLVPNVVIPPKFKVPDFDKYRGSTCPVSHLTMYCRKMAAFAHDDKMLIHYFQDSLAGAVSSWYMHLEGTHIRCWKDLADAFLKQYKYNIDIAPDRAQLQNMVKRNHESFREYAQRWRGLAAQVAPPLLEKEMVSMFMDTLQSPFYDRLIGSISSNFSDMVTIGEKLESGMRNGKITHGSIENNEGETNSITGSGKASYTSKNRPQALHFSTQTSKSHGPPNYPERKHVPFDPIPVSYSDMFNHLTSHNLISPRPMRPIEPPFPRGYDPNATCDFHAGAIGHSVENCKALRHVIQDLIESNWLNFNEVNNPLLGA